MEKGAALLRQPLLCSAPYHVKMCFYPSDGAPAGGGMG